MTNQGGTGGAASWPLSDFRTPEQIRRDAIVVRQQIESLAAPNEDTQERAKLDAMVERIRRRQQAAPADQSTRFVSIPGDDERAVLAVEGQLVVDADATQLNQLGGLLADYAPADRVGRKPHRRTRVYRSKKEASVPALRAHAKRIRDERQISASVNMVVPLGYVIKGSDYPGVTSGPAAFAPRGGGAPVRVAIIDTGLTAEQRTDDWYDGMVRDGTDPVNVLAPLNRIDWFAGHGSFAAGVVRQIAPNAEIVVYRFTNTDGLGTDESAADMLIQAADDAAGQRLIINASFGAPAVDGVPPLSLRAAVEYITDKYPKSLIVASAGNDGSDQPVYPAGFGGDGLRAVGALNSDLTAAAFSNHGDWVHCSAVGVGVVSTFVQGMLPPEDGLGVPDVMFPADPWATWSGTSFTAPQIAGALAALCGDTPTLLPRTAFDQLIAGRPTVPGLGTAVHLLPGTPV
jgi:hypothetical protein